MDFICNTDSVGVTFGANDTGITGISFCCLFSSISIVDLACSSERNPERHNENTFKVPLR